jgi:hypothetical protein
MPWLVGLVCVGPFAFAVALYYGPWSHEWLPRLPGTRELLTVPVALPPAWIDGRADAAVGEYPWSLIYARISACEQQCAQHLGRLLQVYLALGRDQERVRRLYLHAGAAQMFPDDPQLSLRRLDDEVASALLRALGAERLAQGRVYIADPQGNVVVSYPAEVEQKELLRDLKRLLSVSGTG